MDALQPTDAQQVAEIVAWAAAEKQKLEVRGGGSKRALGRPVEAERVVDLTAMAGITLYEPEELVLSAASGTARRQIDDALAAHHQQLAFEPPDLGPLLGAGAGGDTIGGIIACNLSGPRRFNAGAARDHFLGVSAVSGRGETFKSGGRVVKNVTGYDMCKLLAGSYGTLAVMTQVTLKVLPAPEEVRTLVLHGLDDAAATRAMTAALASSHSVSGAAHLPAGVAARTDIDGGAATLLRVEGFGPSVAARVSALTGLLRDHGDIDMLDGVASETLWRQIRDVAPFVAQSDWPVWRISAPPQSGHEVVAAVAARHTAEWFFDWGGGLVWLALKTGVADAGAGVADAGAAVRAAVTDGHATLIRAPEETRAAVPVFQPQPAPLAALTRRIKEGFDPKGILNPGRMYAEG